MGLKQIIAALDDEISRLRKARTLLAGAKDNAIQTSFTPNANQTKTRKRRKLSAEARARIAAAQRKRWAAQRKSAK